MAVSVSCGEAGVQEHILSPDVAPAAGADSWGMGMTLDGIGGTGFSDAATDAEVDDADFVDTVSILLKVDDRFGVGKFLNEPKSHVMDFLTEGLVLPCDDAIDGGGDGRSL